MLMLNMLERMALMTMFTYIILRTNIMKYLVKAKYDQKDKIIIVIVFSILAILGTYFGIYITDNSLANSRPIGAIVAGYLGGPIIGIIVGCISGLHRYSLGGFTALACALSTIAEGAIGGCFRKLFKNQNLNPAIAGLAAVVAEITQMIIILIFSNDLNGAIELERKIALSMIVINPIGVFLIVSAIESSKKLVDGEVKLVKLKEENKIAELKALKAQIEPHFLFNSLNVISAYCRTDGEKARELILNLSNYFRSTLEIEGDFSTLDKELRLIKAYVAIEEARFSNRLLVKFLIDDNLLNIKFPILLLQPIVENAIKHGILKKIDGGIVSIFIKDNQDEVYVEISDNGVGFEDTEKSVSTGIGLKNVNNRLRFLYGEKYKLNIESSNEGSCVSFSIPKEGISKNIVMLEEILGNWLLFLLNIFKYNGGIELRLLDEIKIVIVEDERISNDELKYIVSKDKRFKVVGQAYDGINALKLIENEEPEVVFIDINIPGKSGIELAEEVKELLPDVILIFLTAYENYAIKAFELKIYDYILKPYDEKRIMESLNCALSTINNKNESSIINILDKLEQTKNIKRIPCENNGRIILIDVSKISFCYSEGEKNYVKTDKEIYYTTKTLQELGGKTNFFRCHRSYIVNLEKVKEVYPWFNGTYKLIIDNKDSDEIPVSRSHVKEVKVALGLWYKKY